MVGLIPEGRASRGGRHFPRFLGIVLVLLASPVLAQLQSPDDRWISDPAELEQRLRAASRVTWSDTTLRDVLDSFSRTHRIALFLDRRVDPGQPVELDVDGVSVFETLQQVLDQCGLCSAWLDGICYIATAEDVGRLMYQRASLQTALRGMPGQARRYWASDHRMQWPRLSVPAELAGEWFDESRCRWAAPLPHDLWPAFAGPRARRLDQILLMTHGFDRPLRLDPDSGLLLVGDSPRVSLDEPVPFRFRLPAVPAQRRREVARSVQQEFSSVDFRLDESALVATVRPEEIGQILRHMDRVAYAVDPAGGGAVTEPQNRVVTLQTRASRGAVLNSIARELDLQLQFDPAVRPVLEQQVELDVKRASYDELIRKTLAGTALVHEIGQGRLLIRPQQ